MVTLSVFIQFWHVSDYPKKFCTQFCAQLWGCILYSSATYTQINTVTISDRYQYVCSPIWSNHMTTLVSKCWPNSLHLGQGNYLCLVNSSNTMIKWSILSEILFELARKLVINLNAVGLCWHTSFVPSIKCVSQLSFFLVAVYLKEKITCSSTSDFLLRFWSKGFHFLLFYWTLHIQWNDLILYQVKNIINYCKNNCLWRKIHAFEIKIIYFKG